MAGTWVGQKEERRGRRGVAADDGAEAGSDDGECEREVVVSFVGRAHE